MKPRVGAVPPADEATTVYTLNNGMKVLIREDHFAPVVALQVWVEAGGADERDDELGVAHVHEHMLFKGTENRGVGEIAQEIESSGGQINAWTSWNETVYHIAVASQHAGTGLEVLADAMQHSSFDPEELSKELGVVLEEWKRGEDTPSQKIFHALFDAAYTTHPYRRPVIGTKDSIEGLTRPKILDFYHRYYAPNNMMLVIVGDVDTREMKKRIERTFGDFEQREIPRPPRTAEPPQTTLRSSSLRMDVKQAQLAFGFHIPAATHEDAPLLDLLSFVLGGGESSRLYRRLVADDELATSASAFSYTPPDPGLFVVNASVESKDLDKAYRAAIEEVAQIRERPVSADELERARTNLESDFVYKNETMQGQARELGYSMMVYGDPNWDRVYLEALRRATIQDLQRVAQQYLTRDNMTVVTLLPKDAKEDLAKAEIAKDAALLARAVKAPVASERPELSALPAEATGAAAGGERSEPRLVTLDNGVRIIVEEHRGVPVFAVRAAMIGGLITENRANNGISNFTAEMLMRGSAKRSREQIARDVESLAGSLSGSSGYNSLGLAGSFLTAHVDEALDLFLETLLEPAFDPTEVEKTRRELLLAIKNRDDNPARVAFNLAYTTVFPGHPFGMTTLGETESIASLKPDDLREYYRRSLHPENLVLTVVGDVDSDAIVQRLSAAVGSLAAKQPPLELPPPPAPSAEPRRAERPMDRKQSHVITANQSVDVKHPDRYPLTVLENILSGQGGRLFFELRDRKSLAYSVSAFFTKGLAPGLFGGYIGTDPANSERALDGLLEEFEKVRTERVQDSELSRSQRYLIGSRAIGLQTNGAKAEEMALNELYGLGYRAGDEYDEKISSVTAQDVQRVAREYLDPRHRSEVIVGPPSNSRAAAAH
jgi:zinc protease